MTNERPTQPAPVSRRVAEVLRTRVLWLAATAVMAAVVGTAIWIARTPGTKLQQPGVASVGPPAAGAGNESTATPADMPPADDLVESVENELRQAETHYEKALQGLERIAGTQEQSLDPRVATTLRGNLAVIDKAIAESRAALKTQPESDLAHESLIEAFRRKIGLLQDTIALVNEMRKGNEAEAARIAKELNKG